MLKIQLHITGINCILKYILIENSGVILYHNIDVHCIFNQINAASVRIIYKCRLFIFQGLKKYIYKQCLKRYH